MLRRTAPLSGSESSRQPAAFPRYSRRCPDRPAAVKAFATSVWQNDSSLLSPGSATALRPAAQLASLSESEARESEILCDDPDANSDFGNTRGPGESRPLRA